MQALSGGVGVSYEADLWSLGCIIFQMLTGKPPFRAGSEYLTFEKILALDYQIPEHTEESACQIIRALLQNSPQARLGIASQSPCRPMIRLPLPGYVQQDSASSKGIVKESDMTRASVEITAVHIPSEGHDKFEQAVRTSKSTLLTLHTA